jgi:outer membrane receptor for ferrienterochelin and colicins
MGSPRRPRRPAGAAVSARRLQRRKKYLPTGAYDTQPVYGTYNHDRRGYAELRFDRAVQGVQVAARAAYDGSWYHGNFINVDPPPHRMRISRRNGPPGSCVLDCRVSFSRASPWVAKSSSSCRCKPISPFAGNPPIGKDLIASAYLVDDIHVSNRLNVNLGARSDDYTKSFGTTFNPRLAIVAKPYLRGNTKLFFGRSFRAPSPNERANNPTEICGRKPFGAARSNTLTPSATTCTWSAPCSPTGSAIWSRWSMIP